MRGDYRPFIIRRDILTSPMVVYSNRNVFIRPRKHLIIRTLRCFIFFIAALLTLISCDNRPVSVGKWGCYVYYLDESPFGYLEVTELGTRSDAEGRLTLTKYDGVFRLTDDREREYAISVIAAFREDGRLVYISFNDGETSADARYGERSVRYTVRGDNRVYSLDYGRKPAFLRFRDFFIPVPFDERVGFYPVRLQALDLESGATETVSCRAVSAGRIYLDFRGYAATLTLDDDVFEGFTCSDGVAIKKEDRVPDRDLIAFNLHSQAVALPFVLEGAAEVIVPLSVKISRSFDPDVLGESFKGECLGGRAEGEFTFTVPPRENAFLFDSDGAPATGTAGYGPDELVGDIYCCGLEFVGGNLLHPVYWRETPDERESRDGRFLLARSAEPVRVVAFDVNGPPDFADAGAFFIGEPAFSVSPKDPLKYNVFFEGELVGDLTVAGYKNRTDGSLYFRTAGDVFGSHVISSSPASLGSISGAVLRPVSLTALHPEAFLAVGAAMVRERKRTFPDDFFVPAPNTGGFVSVEFSAMASYPVGTISKTCYVYECGGTRVAFDESGVPVKIESGDFALVLKYLPKLTPVKTYEAARPPAPVAPEAVEDGVTDTEEVAP